MLARQQSFPLSTLPFTGQRAAAELIRNVGVPTELAGTAVITTMSAAVHGCFDVEPLLGMTIPSSLAGFAVAPSGCGKTVVETKLTQGFRKFEDVMRARYESIWSVYQSELDSFTSKRKAYLTLIKEGTKAGDDIEDVQEKLYELDRNLPKPPKLVKVILKDLTPTGIQNSLHQNHPVAYVTLDEAADFLDKRMADLIGTLNSTWSNSDIIVDTAQRQVFVKSPRLAWLVQVQPKAYERFIERLGSRVTDEGMFARLLTVFVEPNCFPHMVPQIQSWNDTNKFNENCLQHLLTSVDEEGNPVQRKLLRFDSQAQAVWNEERDRINFQKTQIGVHQNFPELCAKAPENIARIAAVSHAFENLEGDISGLTMRNAIELFNWFANEQIRMLSTPPKPAQELVDANTLLHWFANLVRTQNNFLMRKNDLQKNGPRSVRVAVRLNAALLILEQNNVLKVGIPEGQKGVWVHLNPQFFNPWQIQQLCNGNLFFPI